MPTSGVMAAVSFTGGVTAMSFGVLEKPASGSRTFTVATNGATSGTGTLLSGVASNAQVQLRRAFGDSSNNSMQLSITGVATGHAALTLGSFTGMYGATTITSFPATVARPANNAAGTILRIGATLTYTSASPEEAAPRTMTFDIVAVYP